MNTVRAVFIFSLATLSMQVWGLDCSSVNITLTTQQQVDDFQATYGGGGVCNRITGRLWVEGSDISDIDGLANLTSIGGSLRIYSNAVLTDLDGLANLTSVGVALQIGSNNALTDLDGLANLTSVGGSLSIISNAALTDLDGLANVTSVIVGIQIIENPILTNLNGLAGITGLDGDLNVASNTALTNLDGLTGITSVGGYFQIAWNPKLANLDGLVNISNVGETFYIIKNYQLGHCSALASLLGWPVGPPDDNVGGTILVESTNDPGCNSVQEILDSVSGPTAPNVISAGAISGQVELVFSPASTTDGLWPITGYYAQCLSENFGSENSMIIDIPDLDSVVSNLTLSGVPFLNAPELNVAVDITHPRTRHLTLILMSPHGTNAKLWDEAVGDGTDLIGTFPTTLEPAESLDAFDGEDFNGEWQLTVADGVALQTGTLNSWGITVQDKVTATSEASPITLTGLTDSQPYSCMVSAITDLGIGPASNTVSVTPTPDLLFSDGFEGD